MGISAKKAQRILRIRKIEEDLAKSKFYAAARAYREAVDEARNVGRTWSQIRDSEVQERTIGYSAYFHMRENAQMRVRKEFTQLSACREELMSRTIRRRIGEKLLEYAKNEAQSRQLRQEIALLDDIKSYRKEVKDG
ncbi:hypothetical protein HPY42_01805 [Coprothermobacteraceae bacterium]|nr:hypothetical protein [Coprothermobacteraceae bacterium]